MSDEAEVKALANEYRKINLGFCEPPGVTVSSWRSGTGYLTEASAEALARVALEWCEERRKKRVHTVTEVTAGFFPGGAEGILEETWEEEVE